MSSNLTHRDIIYSLGGPAEVAKWLGLRAGNTTTHWLSRGIPVRYWALMEDLAAERGVLLTASDLARSLYNVAA